MLYKLRISGIVEETPDARTFVFGEANIPFEPGQFLTFVFQKPHGREDRRSYSISSGPGEPLQVTVKRVANGAYSRWFIDEARVGDILYTTGASGYFLLPALPGSITDVIFFAAGSGITPVFSLMKQALASFSSVRLHLIYSSGLPASTIFLDALDRLRGGFPDRLTIDYLFSAYPAGQRKRLNVALIEQTAKQYTHNSLFYLCGPSEYMRTIRIVLLTAGVPEEHIRKEIFYTEAIPRKAMPPDVLPHSVTLLVKQEAYTFRVQFPDSILQAAKKHGAPVPYSCEAGQCGTCSVTCESGKVWMSYNEVLPDEEIAQGRVLTCTGYPVGGDVIIRL